MTTYNDGTNWTLHKSKGTEKYYGIKIIFEDSQDRIWIGHGQTEFKVRGRVRSFDGEKWTRYAPKLSNRHPAMPNKCIQTIVEDKKGNIWVGEGFGSLDGTNAGGGGIKRFDGINWQEFTVDNGLPDSKILRITDCIVDRDGNVWFTAGLDVSNIVRGYGQYGGVYRFDGTKWTLFTTEDGLQSNLIYSILEDSKGTIWVGTSNGVAKYDGVKWSNELSLNDKVLVSDLFIDSKGSLWYATFRDGIYKYSLNAK